MGNKNISLSFDTAEYYNLKEASEYLNRKNKIENITKKKLLKKIYQFNLDAYCFGKGFSLMGTHYLNELVFLKDLDESSPDYEVYIGQIDNYLFNCDIRPSNACKGHGLFLQLSNRMISQLLFLGHADISDEWSDIKGLLHHSRLDADPNNVEEFLHPIQIPSNYKGEDFYFNQIKVAQSTYKPILSEEDIEDRGLQEALEKINLKVVEHHHFEDFQITSYEGSNHYFNNKNTVSLTLEITIDDILILHKDLEKLEKYIVEDLSLTEETEKLFQKKGVSPILLKAKLIANVHAQSLWKNDHDKKIRIGEMCEHIWVYLLNTEYQTMLPERRSSLKNWLNDIPEYASQPGKTPQK